MKYEREKLSAPAVSRRRRRDLKLRHVRQSRRERVQLRFAFPPSEVEGKLLLVM